MLAGGVDALIAASVQGTAGLNAPVPELANETVPDGLEALPTALASVTVAVQALPWLTITGDVQLTAVELLRTLTVRLELPELIAWTVLPP